MLLQHAAPEDTVTTIHHMMDGVHAGSFSVKCRINLTLLSVNHFKSFPIDSHRVVTNVGHNDFMSAIKFC